MTESVKIDIDIDVGDSAKELENVEENVSKLSQAMSRAQHMGQQFAAVDLGSTAASMGNATAQIESVSANLGTATVQARAVAAKLDEASSEANGLTDEVDKVNRELTKTVSRTQKLKQQWADVRSEAGKLGEELSRAVAPITAKLAPIGNRIAAPFRAAAASVRQLSAGVAARLDAVMSRADASVERMVRSAGSRAPKALAPLASRAAATESAISSAMSKVSSHLRPVGERMSSLGGSVGRLMGTYLEPLSERFKRVGKSGESAFDGIKKKLGGMSKAIGLTFAGMATAAAYGGARATGEIARKSAFGESSRSAIQQLTHGGTAEGARAQFDEIRRMSQELGLSVEGTTESYKGLLRMQFDPAAAKDIIKMGADLQAVGVHAEETQGVIMTMSQIKAKGRLQSEELMQLQERGISGELVQDALMSRLGISDKATYQKKLSAGQISSDDALAAIQAAVMKKTNSSKLGDAGSKYAKSTMAGQFASAKALGENAIIDMGDRMAPVITKVIGSVRSILTSVLDGPGAARFGASMLAAFDKVSTWVDANGDRIAEVIGGAFEAAADAVDNVVAALEWLDENVGSTDLMFQSFGTRAKIIFGAISYAIGGVVLGLAALSTAMGFTEELWLAFWSFDWAGAAYEWGENLLQGLINGINSKVQAVKDSVYGVWNSIESTFTGEAEIHSPSAATHRWGAHLDQGIINGVEANLDRVSLAASGLASAAMPPWPANTNHSVSVPGVVPAVAGGAAPLAVAGGAGRGGSPTIVINVTVEAPKGGTKQDGERYGQGVAAGIERDVMSWLAGVAETGT